VLGDGFFYSEPVYDKHGNVIRASESNPKRFKFLSPAELAELPEPSWLIHGVLPEGALCVLYGDPGCGKTFVALSIALSVAAGHCWCGKPTVNGTVLYVGAEGVVGLQRRVEAYQKQNNLVAEDIRYLGTALNLAYPNEVKAFVTELREARIQPVLIVFDTLARLMVGADENSAKDMGLAIAGMDRIRQATSATFLVIHHKGKSGGAERGSSALRAAADVMIECDQTKRGLVGFACDKMKDAEPFKRGLLELEAVPLGESSSLAITTWRDAGDSDDSDDSDDSVEPVNVDAALGILEKQFGSVGASHKEWKQECLIVGKMSESTFARILRRLKNDPRVRHDGKRYYAVRKADGVGVKEVSSGVMTHPG
jgi:hypothetical protein